MKGLLLLLAATGAWAQTTGPAPVSGSAMLGQKDAEQVTTRMLQLMESTAVAVPGLIPASEPLRQNAQATFTAMQRTPQNAALTYQFINQVKAYLALADSIPRPNPFPATAGQQYSELREDLQRMQQHFEAVLQFQSAAVQRRDADPNDLKRYAEANAKMLPQSNLPRVVFLGDSITDGWRLNEYFTGRDFVNRGISGQTTIQMLARFRQDVIALNPKAVAVLGGTNDIASGVTEGQIEDNLAMIAELAKAHGMKTVFGSILPVSDYHKDVDPRYEMTKTHPPATIQSINRWIQNYCQTAGCIYMDYYSAMVDPMGQLQADLSDDGLHPNAKGYRVMSPIALDAVGRALANTWQDFPDTQPKRRFRILNKTE